MMMMTSAGREDRGLPRGGRIGFGDLGRPTGRHGRDSEQHSKCNNERKRVT
jgi:hypothetical protein